jgi:hypothetical protein
VLHLQGKGDGTFQISGNRVSLSAVPDLLGSGQTGVLVGNQQDNRVTVQAPGSGGGQFAPVQTLGGADPSAQLAPGDVRWFTLDRNATLPDAVVVSSGSNAVTVYRTLGIRDGVLSFAPPQTVFVGTAPASVTVADLNGDGVPDMVVANQGSNDVSVIFGSYGPGGGWVGTPGPRLRSGGDGPTAVTVRDQDGDGVPDLVVTNGGSGTITLLRGVGQGFFDDQHPRTLFDLGSAVAQPPTFVGDSGLGYAVTADGELVRFDLDDPGPARVVFSGADVLAARALPGGQVVVATADGSVEVLSPGGDGLAVATRLQARGGVPTLPSALEVLQAPGGQTEVLVSSQGSDTIFVFSAAGAKVAPAPETAGGGGPSASVAPVPFGGAATVGSPLSAAGGAEGGGTAAVTAAAVAPAPTVAGTTFSAYLWHDSGDGTAGTSAVLVPIQGNTYSTVAVLDFDAPVDDQPAGTRMPWLSARHPLGDASPLGRFVTGHEEAVRHYRAAQDASRFDDGASLVDPWDEDLFHRSSPVRRPPDEQRGGEPMGDETSRGGRLPDEEASGAAFWDRCSDDPSLLASATPDGATLACLAALLAGAVLRGSLQNLNRLSVRLVAGAAA